MIKPASNNRVHRDFAFIFFGDVLTLRFQTYCKKHRVSTIDYNVKCCIAESSKIMKAFEG